MKYFYIGILILCLLLSACYLSSNNITKRTESLIQPLEQARYAAGHGDQSAKVRYLNVAAHRWMEHQQILSCLLSHSYTFQIDHALADLFQLRADEFTLQCDALIRTLRQIQTMDLPKPENIL